MMSNISVQIELNRVLEFIGLVKSGAKYDIKTQSEWRYPYSKYHGSNVTNKAMTPFLYFNGELWSAESLGNFAFGYYGAAYGYSVTFLNVGGGFYQKASGGSEWTWAESYYDDPRDYAEIQRGYSYYTTGVY